MYLSFLYLYIFGISIGSIIPFWRYLNGIYLWGYVYELSVPKRKFQANTREKFEWVRQRVLGTKVYTLMNFCH